jgi:hypothetical protein
MRLIALRLHEVGRQRAQNLAGVTHLRRYSCPINMVSAMRDHNIESVMIDGRWTMFDRKLLTIDAKLILREAKDRAA